jgi:hypothetical protein
MTTLNRMQSISRRSAAVLVAAGLLLIGGLAPQRAAAQTGSATVRLVIDYGDGTIKTFADLPWSKGATVLDVMNAAKARPRGITFSHRGSGATAFLREIDGVASQGGGVGKKNWQLWVNTAYADRSFAVYQVQALDVIFWRFAPPQGK